MNSNHILIANPHCTSIAIDFQSKRIYLKKKTSIAWLLFEKRTTCVIYPVVHFLLISEAGKFITHINNFFVLGIAYNQHHWFGYSEILILGKLWFLLSDTFLSVLNLIPWYCFFSAQCCKHPLYSWITMKSVTMYFTEITRMTESNKISILNFRNK